MKIFRIRFTAAAVTFVVGTTITGFWIAICKPFLWVNKPRTQISERKPLAGEQSLNLPPNNSLAETVLALRANRVDSFDSRVPPAAQVLIAKLKHQLRDLIHETLNSYAYEDDSPRRLETVLNDGLKTAGVEITRDMDEPYTSSIPEDYSYGDIYEFKATRPAGHRNLIAVTATIGVCCGKDISLYLFKYEAHNWNLILGYESPAYNEIDGAYALLKYDFSPLENDGGFFVVVANVTPWCTSNWQQLRYVVLKPVVGTSKPKVILSKTNTIYLGVDDPVYELSLEHQGFRLSLFDEKMMEMANEGIDSGPDGIKAKRFISYRVKGNSAILRFRR